MAGSKDARCWGHAGASVSTPCLILMRPCCLRMNGVAAGPPSLGPSRRTGSHCAVPARSTSVATIFASSGGEMGVLINFCRALATTERIISPTLFHQSVDNRLRLYGHCNELPAVLDGPLLLRLFMRGGTAGGSSPYATMEDCPALFVVNDLPAPDPLIRAQADTVGLRNGIGLDRFSCRRVPRARPRHSSQPSAAM